MRFFSFANQKTVDGNTGLRTVHRGCHHNGISAQSQTANGIGVPALLPNQLKKNLAGKGCALSVERGGATVKVIVALGARRKSEVSQAKRDRRQQIEESFARGQIHN